MMPLLISLMIGALGLAVHKRTRCWSHPAVIFSLFWCVMSALPLMLVWDHLPAPEGGLYLLAASLAFAAPVFLRHNWAELQQTAVRRNGRKSVEVCLLVAFLGLQGAAAALILSHIQLQGIPIRHTFSNPISVGNSYLALRYTGGLKSSLAGQLAVIFNYAGVALAGIAVAKMNRLLWQVTFGGMALVPSAMMLVLYADKGTLLLATAYFFGGIVVGHVAGGSTSLLTRRSAIVAAVCAIAMVPVVVGALLIKATGGSWTDSSEMLVSLRFYIVSYSGAHLYAFSDWFSEYLAGTAVYADPEGYTWGYWTFLGLARLIEPAGIVAGYYDEYFRIPGTLMSNIYTMFRGLIYDFGIVGSLAFVAAVGGIASEAYRSMLKKEHSPLAQSIYIFIIGAIYSSYLISITTWNSVYVSSLIVTIVLFLSAFSPMQRNLASPGNSDGTQQGE